MSEGRHKKAVVKWNKLFEDSFIDPKDLAKIRKQLREIEYRPMSESLRKLLES